MAFSYTVKDRLSWGNLKCVALTLTDVQDDGTSIINLGCDTVHGIKANNGTDVADTFKEAVGAASASTTRNIATVTAGTNDDDGLAVVWYR